MLDLHVKYSIFFFFFLNLGEHIIIVCLHWVKWLFFFFGVGLRGGKIGFIGIVEGEVMWLGMGVTFANPIFGESLRDTDGGGTRATE